jgi:hypothetical protein
LRNCRRLKKLLTIAKKLNDIYNAVEIGLFYHLQPSKTFTLQGNFGHGGMQSKQQVTLLMCSVDATSCNWDM